MPVVSRREGILAEANNLLNLPWTRSVNSACTEVTYVNTFHLKESGREGTNHLRSTLY